MVYEILDLNQYEDDEDLMDLDIEAVRMTKVPYAFKRFVIERYYYCARCAAPHSFNHCPTAPTH